MLGTTGEEKKHRLAEKKPTLMSLLTLDQQKGKCKTTGETILGERVKEMTLTYLKASYTHIINKKVSIHGYGTAVSDCTRCTAMENQTQQQRMV